MKQGFVLSLFLALLVPCITVNGQTQTNASFANEDADWGIPPTKQLHAIYHEKTPLSVPGARTIKTTELKTLFEQNDQPVVIDVLGGDVSRRLVIPRSVFMGIEPGESAYYGTERARFETALQKLTEGNKDKALVFYCLSSECWLSYNAALKAVDAGYTNVMWYRGGFAAWKAAGYPFVGARPYTW